MEQSAPTSASPRVAVVIPYFGSAPAWMPLFLKSCARNPGFDWILMTDFDVPCALPNVRRMPIELSEFYARFEEVLSVDLSRVRGDAYKVCEVRPMMGLVFEDMLRDYDYWGYGDLDVIYGDLAANFGAQLGQYDVITSHTYLLAGHFSLFRNTSTLRALFSCLPSWREVIASPLHHAFDEKVMSTLFFQGMPDRQHYRYAPLYCPKIVVNGETLHGHFCEKYTCSINRLHLFPDGSMGRTEAWFWRDGVLSSDKMPNASLAYAHFATWNTARYAHDGERRLPWVKGGMVLDLDLHGPIKAFRINAQGFHGLDS